jgi:hypothetical protein
MAETGAHKPGAFWPLSYLSFGPSLRP